MWLTLIPTCTKSNHLSGEPALWDFSAKASASRTSKLSGVVVYHYYLCLYIYALGSVPLDKSDSYNEHPDQENNGCHAWYRARGAWNPASKPIARGDLGVEMEEQKVGLDMSCYGAGITGNQPGALSREVSWFYHTRCVTRDSQSSRICLIGVVLC